MTLDELSDYCESNEVSLTDYLMGEREVEDAEDVIGTVVVVENKKVFEYGNIDKEIHTVFNLPEHNLFIKVVCASDNYENPSLPELYTQQDLELSDRFGSNIIEYFEVRPMATLVTYEKTDVPGAAFIELLQYCATNFIDFAKIMNGGKSQNILLEGLDSGELPEIDTKKVRGEIGSVKIVFEDWLYHTALSDTDREWIGQRICYFEKGDFYVYDKVEEDGGTLRQIECYEVAPQSEKAIEYKEIE
jgi:hypothetical protein